MYFGGKIMSLLFNMLSILVIAFILRSKCLLVSWLWSPSAVILESRKIKFCHYFHCFPIYLPWSVGTRYHEHFFECWVLSQIFPSHLSLSSRGSLVPFHFLLWVVSSAYLKLMIFLPAILIPSCASSNPAFYIMYSAYMLNKQGDNIQPWWTPFPFLNQSVVPCPVLAVASWSAYRFLRKQIRWSDIPISLRIFHSLLWSTQSQWQDFSVVSETEVDVFLEFSCFFYDPMDIGNLMSGFFAFSKSSLNIRKFSVHVLLKPGLEDFEHYLASTWNDCNCAVVWTFFGIAFLGIGMKTDLFKVLWPLLSFPDLLAYWVQHFHSIIF